MKVLQVTARQRYRSAFTNFAKLVSFKTLQPTLTFPNLISTASGNSRIFYGWYIVAPFFGRVHDATGSYLPSFVTFVLALGLSAMLSIAVRPPQKSQHAG
jgi:hypothetical protein